MSAPTSRPAVVVVGPKSEFSVDDQLEARAGGLRELIEQLGHERGHRDARHDADPLAVEARQVDSSPPATRLRSAATAPTPFSICGKSP